MTTAFRRARRDATAASSSCTATGSSARCRTPRTSCRRRCWPRGAASTASRSAHRCARGCTGSRPTARLNLLRDRGRRPLPAVAAVAGADRASASRCGSTRTRATRRARRSGSRSSPPCSACRRASARCSCCATCSASAPPRSRRCSSSPSPRSRARCTGRARRPSIPRDEAPLPDSREERALVARFTEAFERGDVDGVVALLTADARLTMPPYPLEYEGPEAIRGFLSTVPAGGDLVAGRARRRRAPTGSPRSAATSTRGPTGSWC